MGHIKKFEDFSFAEAPTKEPAVKPSVKPATPGVRPNRPSPIRRTMPAVKPAPKAELTEASIEDVVAKYIELTK